MTATVMTDAGPDSGHTGVGKLVVTMAQEVGRLRDELEQKDAALTEAQDTLQWIARMASRSEDAKLCAAAKQIRIQLGGKVRAGAR